jgi:hypothetical protein
MGRSMRPWPTTTTADGYPFPSNRFSGLSAQHPGGSLVDAARLVVYRYSPH